MVFNNDEEEKKALKYINLAKLNNITGVKIIYGKDLKQIERNINPNILGAVYAPTAGIISPFEAVIAIIENAAENGAKLLTETMAKNIKIVEDRVESIITNRAPIKADIIINAAVFMQIK